MLGNSNQKESKLVGYADAGCAGHKMSLIENQTVDTFFNIMTVINWTCRKQSCVVLLATEAEYIALADACQEAIWLRNLLEDFGHTQNEATTIYEDNQSCIKLTKNHKFSKRTKHVDTKFHYVKHLKELSLLNCYCDTEHMMSRYINKTIAGC